MRLGTKIENFIATTTIGDIDFYEWQENSWVVLFSHPADFTPVCTTELGRMAVNIEEFTKRNVKCLAHSVDELSSHTAWINDIKSYCRELCGDFPFPLIADPDAELAVKFGMLDENQAKNAEDRKTVRALFIISPDHRVRLSMFYPLTTGRNLDEILRCLDSLQLHDRHKLVGTPANWMPGDKLMALPSASKTELENAFPKGFKITAMPSGNVYIRTIEDY